MIHFYVLNLLIMIAECVWSLMVIPVSRVGFIAISSVIYVGVYFLWKHINNNQWMLDPPHGSVPIEVVITVGIIAVYVAAFWLMFCLVAFRDRMFTRGLFTKEEKYHIIDSQNF